MQGAYVCFQEEGNELLASDMRRKRQVRLRLRSGRTFFAEGFSHSRHSLFETEL